MSKSMKEALLSGNEYIAEIDFESFENRASALVQDPNNMLVTQADIDKWNAGSGTGGAPDYTFEIGLDGNLYVTFPDGATPPDFSLNANGELIYNY